MNRRTKGCPTSTLVPYMKAVRPRPGHSRNDMKNTITLASSRDLLLNQHILNVQRNLRFLSKGGIFFFTLAGSVDLQSSSDNLWPSCPFIRLSADSFVHSSCNLNSMLIHCLTHIFHLHTTEHLEKASL